MELFSGGELDRMFMEKSGCVNYSYTSWVSENSGVYERAVYYKFEKRISRYKVEVTSTQQKSTMEGGKGWLLQEVMNFHGVPLGDFFNVSKPNLACSSTFYDVFVVSLLPRLTYICHLIVLVFCTVALCLLTMLYSCTFAIKLRI